MNIAFKEPKFNESSFTCPHCQVVAQMDFFIPSEFEQEIIDEIIDMEQIANNSLQNLHLNKAEYERLKNRTESIKEIMQDYRAYANTFCVCQNCNEINIWINQKMVYPKARLTPLPNEDLPDEIKADYEEASNILQDSPRGACALLRLALQKLMIYIGEDRNLDRATKDLMEDNKVDEDVRKALDSVRIVGNSAVHPNELEIKDKPEIALKLFRLINFIAREVITSRKKVREFYSEEIPESAKRENREKITMQKILFDTYEYNDRCRFVLGNSGKNPLICIGINPSNATNQKSDPTIRKIQKIIQHNGYDGFMMINLCSKISSCPRDIPRKLVDCYHQDNLRHIENISKKYPNSNVLACWGDSFYIREYLSQMLLDIMNKLGKHRKWFHLKDLTKKGNPRHPLYVAFDFELKTFDINSYVKN